MNFYKIGTIVNTHGIKGEVRVIATTDFIDERFKKNQKVYLDNQAKTPLVIATVRKHKQFILVSFLDMANINFVERFKGLDLLVDEVALAPLDEGEYYYKDIIGAIVIDQAGQTIGSVKEIFETGANDVWVVQRVGKDDLLLPMIDDVIKSVDINNNKIIVDILEGLDD
ncbi:ribosome maturation factor RimM [Periweissella beninensis]|uniref:Ribosome maturation factor RimM n=1 Tax=Periweissella beninensis TaxID=504936 RepID=A0ABT0VH63_9LACO|nr:ribosome maturation factor RimM [Periweissella beninensis]MBM7543496.1 16S rRNA processing protein RimM [Periweissella beninensis]MCM2436478.1 ribosome maturation factor RimM [Periweissella beninensis]MCT4396196.1 ribosome maturation factor RimM [Periweissella beninensis]